jgi:3-oxoacyl-[acyl-carrier-protein] synthase-3
MRARILSVGTSLPARVVENAEIEARLGQPPGWILDRTGVRRRHAAADGELGYHLGVQAARRALAAAATDADSLDAIVYTTMFCDYVVPGGGVLVQRELGCRRPIPAFDLRDQCAGFLYGLSLGSALVEAGRARRVLVVCAERQHENFLAYEGAAPLFGDAGAAVLLGPSEDSETGILTVELGADGAGAAIAISGCNHVDVFAPENRHPELARALEEASSRPPSGSKLYYWNGAEVFRGAVATMIKSTRAVLDRIGSSPEQVDWFLFHQANLHINLAVMRRLGLDPKRCPTNLERYGNTTSASIPLLLAELIDQGKLERGALLLLSSFGAGYAWGTAALRW